MKYKYYSTQRPVMPGTYPKPKDNPAMLIHNFEKREYVPEIGRLAWGYVEYDKPLEIRILTATNLYQLLSFRNESEGAHEE